jgi:RimJ/RimL family protein N-acetyltransferase
MRYGDRVYPPLPPDLLAERIAAAGPPSFTAPSFMVDDRATGTPIGWCGLHHVSELHRNGELAVMIGDPAYRGRGYGTDATRTLCRFAFDRMNLVRVRLTVFPGNAAAIRAYEKAGFVREGVQRRAFWKRGEWHDLVHLAILRER